MSLCLTRLATESLHVAIPSGELTGSEFIHASTVCCSPSTCSPDLGWVCPTSCLPKETRTCSTLPGPQGAQYQSFVQHKALQTGALGACPAKVEGARQEMSVLGSSPPAPRASESQRSLQGIGAASISSSRKAGCPLQLGPTPHL